jgi:predicted dehydrogenase/threonine dehydrogenase-like Zn-dependent dehydrogenase
MRQILQNVRSGELELTEVPAPLVVPGQLLVRNHYSVMSPGTDRMSMAFARSSLLSKARSRPDLVRQVMQKLRLDGPVSTYRTVTSRLDVPQPLGYSCAGVVEEVGPGVVGFACGDRVACAGAGYANHAELVVVPENLAVPVPEGVSLEHAAFATLGAIALQSVRVSEPSLGEVAGVIGLGLVGQLVVQLLRANGCRVLGLDLKPRRVEQALEQGAEWAETPSSLPAGWTDEATGGHGIDLAVVAASAADPAPLQLAAELCRHKGRLSVVGAMPLEIERRTMYDKELELRMSMSYGPGRYDRNYEELGNDYPLPFVRWTENRNLRAFLHLIHSGDIHLDHLDTRVSPFGDALSAYEELVSDKSESLAVVFRYSTEAEISRQRSLDLTGGKATEPRDGLGVSFIGAGNYAKGVLLPLLDHAKNIRRITLVTATGASAKKTASKFSFSGCGTNPEAIFKDPNVDLVFVATRHDTHTALALEALDNGKAVWLEKPVSLTQEELFELAQRVTETGAFLAVGYNRRFSSHSRAAKKLFAKRVGALSMHYTVAAGPTPRDTWLMDPHEGGGRIVGEACHFVDLCNYVVGHLPTSVFARPLSGDPMADDSTLIVLSYPDHSVATIEYLAAADSGLPKERFEISGDGLTARCDNFRVTYLTQQREFKTFNQDKGQSTEIAEVTAALQAGEPSPFSIEEIVSVSRATFAALKSVATGAPVELDP